MAKKKIDPKVEKLILAVNWLLESLKDADEYENEEGEIYKDIAELESALDAFA